MLRSRIRSLLIISISLVVAVVFAVSQGWAQDASNKEPVRQVFTFMHAAILGIVEGVTEYLPVSSTGHLLITSHFLGLGTDEQKEAADAYAICIQAGAILAVLFLYFGRVKSVFAGIFGRDKNGARLGVNLLVAFIPAVVLALLGEKFIKSHLFGNWPVISAWFAGGFLILAVAWQRRTVDPREGGLLEELTPKQAFLIGTAQCIAMWPGVSRSLATILGGLLVGLSMPATVEFSFLLGLITLSAATAYEAVKSGAAIIDHFGIINPIIGLITSFIAAMVSVKWMVGYLNKHGLEIFGYYRIALAVVVAALLYWNFV